MAKIALFGWEPRFNVQLTHTLILLQECDTPSHPEIAARAKLLTHILEELPNDAHAKNRFASIRQNLEGLVRLIDDGLDATNVEPPVHMVNASRHKRTWRRIATSRVADSAAQLSYSALLRAISQLLRNPNLAGKTRQALRKLIEADPEPARDVFEQTKPSVQQPATENRSPRPSILVAEDDLGCQAVLKMQLATLGYDSAFAANGTTAFGMWRQGDFVAVFADLNMPGADGLTLTRAIRAIESVRGGSIPIIAITATRDSKQLDACLAAGMNDVLPKPIELESMRELLARYPICNAPTPVLEAAVFNEPANESPSLDLNYLLRVIGSENLGHAPELIELFIRSARVDLRLCREQLANPDGGRIGTFMHKLKSSARMIGVLPFAKLAEALEVGHPIRSPDQSCRPD